MIKILLDEYLPKLVIFPGVMEDKKIARKFELSHIHTLRYIRTFSNGKTKTCRVEHYQDGKRSWFFTPHWSSDPGLSGDEKQKIKEYIHTQS